jgi:hypothetical protein
MALHPVEDVIKVRLEKTDEYGLGVKKEGVETGIVTEVPDALHYFGLHSFMFENSFMAEEKLSKLLAYFQGFIGKRVWWQEYQDRGRRTTEADGESYVYLKMSDIMIVADNPDERADFDTHEFTGSFKAASN